MRTHVVALLLTLGVVSPSWAADPKDDVLAVEKSSWAAFAHHDAKAYGDTMTDDAVEILASGDVLMGKQKILADMANHPCNVKSYDLADAKTRMLSPDAAILGYNLTQDVTCEGTKLASRAFVTAVYVRQGGKWRLTSYQETARK